jgi:hypothetical protein
MDEAILQIFQSEFLARCADIPLFVPVCLDDVVDRCDYDVATDVELALVVE